MFQTILFNAIVCTDYHTAEKLDHFLIKEIEHKANTKIKFVKQLNI